jgi:tRNA threonylcarbamoyladenosine biosynthesis protein TsaB
VRILAIETSSLRGSVAFVDGDGVALELEHQRENAHGETILPLIERGFSELGWERGGVDRVAVGVGPGSFTGLRVGIAIAQGLSEGWSVPLIGVPSLQAMALAAPAERGRQRCVLLDARKGELFAAVYAPDGTELVPVRLIPVAHAAVTALAPAGDVLYLGNGTALLPELPDVFRAPETDSPHARYIAAAARRAEPGRLVVPLYVRDAGAVRPVLPENPLGR